MSQKMRASYGDRVLEVMEIVNAMGKATSTQIRPRMVGNPSAGNASKYCSRAVGRGLMKVDRDAKPMTYTVVPEWRDLMAIEAGVDDELPPEKRLTADEVIALARKQPASVWELGSRARRA